MGITDTSTISIASQVHNCLKSFHDVCESLVIAETHITSKIPSDSISDQAGRFRLWSGNIGAHKKGRSSLDYRLREASHVQGRIVDLLQNLTNVLREANDIITGTRQPWEDLSDSESDLSQDDIQGGDMRAETELVQLTSNMEEINTCLMRLSMAIRNPAPHDQFRESRNMDMSHLEHFDIDHVRGKFPNAEEYLISRLGKAISRRRQYLRYRKEHREKLEQGLVPKSHDCTTTGAVAPSDKLQSTIASSIPRTIKANVTTHFNDYEDALSQTSYASSNNDPSKLRPPPLPEAGLKGEPFECTLCCRMTSARQTNLWHKHVYRDLQPYLCTFEDCQIPDHTYESQHEWFSHELDAHRKCWECLEGCNITFHSPDTFRSHLEQDHGYLGSNKRIAEFIRTCARNPPLYADTKCVLCNARVPSIKHLCRHLGKHQQELASFAIPSHARGQLEDDDESVNDEDSRSLSSDHRVGSTVLPEEDACPICNFTFRGEATERRRRLALHLTKLHPDQNQAAVEPDPRFPMFGVLLDRRRQNNDPDKVRLAAMTVLHWRGVIQKRKERKILNEPLGDPIANEDYWAATLSSHDERKNKKKGAKDERSEAGVEAMNPGDNAGHSSQAALTLTIDDTKEEVIPLRNAHNGVQSSQGDTGGSAQLKSFIQTRRVGQVLHTPLLEDNNDVLEQPIAGEQVPQYDCVFRFLNCDFLSRDKEDWRVHSLSHFRGEEPPRSTTCPLCDWEKSCDTGRDAWNLKTEHLLEQHLVLGETLRTARPDFHLYHHLWQKRLIGDSDLKELKVSCGCSMKFVPELFVSAILAFSTFYREPTTSSFAQRGNTAFHTLPVVSSITGEPSLRTGRRGQDGGRSPTYTNKNCSFSGRVDDMHMASSTASFASSKEY